MCIGIALILGYIYTIISIILPFVYLNFLITLGFGSCIGLICRILVRFSHNRSKKSRIMQAAIVGLLASYFQWTAYILYVFNGNIPSFSLYISNLYWIVVPENFIYAIQEINRIGSWSIFGITFKGFPLTFIWIVEFALILSGPLIATIRTKTYPYSELLKTWYDKYTLHKDFESISATSALLTELSSDPINAVKSLGKGTATRFTKLHVFYLKNEDKQYLTFERVFIAGHGKGEKNSHFVVYNFAINKADAEMILTEFENKREKIEII